MFWITRWQDKFQKPTLFEASQGKLRSLCWKKCWRRNLVFLLKRIRSGKTITRQGRISNKRTKTSSLSGRRKVCSELLLKSPRITLSHEELPSLSTKTSKKQLLMLTRLISWKNARSAWWSSQMKNKFQCSPATKNTFFTKHAWNLGLGTAQSVHYAQKR